MSALTAYQALDTLIDAPGYAGSPLAIRGVGFASRPGTSPMDGLRVCRHPHEGRNVIDVKGIRIGAAAPVVMAGPCSIESQEQLLAVATAISQYGRFVLRGGAFKPRTSPYSFQGLGSQALKYLKQVAEHLDLVSITEVMDPREVELVASYADILQIGSRNMANYPLLREVGVTNKPVMLKRGFAATIDEWINAAEYILLAGGRDIILCERGIRTFENATRNTLDVSAIALVKQDTRLPVIADISHSAGRTDIAIPLARAALAAGADGVMVEVHQNPPAALSDNEQQLDLDEFRDLMQALDFAPRG